MEETWSNEKCLELIDIYGKFPELWDSNHRLYYTKTKRHVSWQTIANHFDLDVTSVKRKMCSLLGSFRAQKSKGKKLIECGSTTKEVYVSKWFAFDKMLFLLDQKEPQQSIGSDECDGGFETFEIKSENDSDIEFFDPNTEASAQNHTNEEEEALTAKNSQNTIINNKETLERIPVDVTLSEDDSTELKSNSNSKIHFNDMNNEYGIHFSQPEGTNEYYNEENFLKRKLKDSYHNEQQNQHRLKMVRMDSPEPNSNLNNNCHRSSEIADTSCADTNNVEIFGQYISSKLKTYTSKTRAIAEHAINNILFEADMGWYENATPQPRIRRNCS